METLQEEEEPHNPQQQEEQKQDDPKSHEDTQYDSDMDPDQEIGDDTNEVILKGWFVKKAPGKGGFGILAKDQRRWCELTKTKIRYFSEEANGAGVPETEKGHIAIGKGSVPMVSDRKLCITNPDRFWELVSEDAAIPLQWEQAIKNLVGESASSSSEDEINLFPGRGEWFQKRGKGLGAFTGDKRRYFSLFYNTVSKSLRMNYFVQLAGRARVPVHKKGYITINTSSKITVEDKRLVISNPGYTWQLSAQEADTAQRWLVTLTKAVEEVKAMKAAGHALPILAFAVQYVQGQPSLPKLDALKEVLLDKYGLSLYNAWEIEITQLLQNAEFLDFAMQEKPIPGAWFMKQPEGMGKERKRWFEITVFDELTYFSRLSNGDSGAPLDQRGILPIRFDSKVKLSAKQLTITSNGRSWVMVADSAKLASTWADKLNELIAIKAREPRHRRSDSLRTKLNETDKKIVPDRGSWLTDAERIEILCRVRDGELSIDEAISKTWDERPENYGNADTFGMTLSGSDKLLEAKRRSVMLKKQANTRWNMELIRVVETGLVALAIQSDFKASTSKRMATGDIVLKLNGETIDDTTTVDQLTLSDAEDAISLELVDPMYVPGTYTFRLPRPCGIVPEEGETLYTSFSVEADTPAALAGIGSTMSLMKVNDANVLLKKPQEVKAMLIEGLPGAPITIVCRKQVQKSLTAAAAPDRKASAQSQRSQRSAYENIVLKKEAKPMTTVLVEDGYQEMKHEPKSPTDAYENWTPQKKGDEAVALRESSSYENWVPSGPPSKSSDNNNKTTTNNPANETKKPSVAPKLKPSISPKPSVAPKPSISPKPNISNTTTGNKPIPGGGKPKPTNLNIKQFTRKEDEEIYAHVVKGGHLGQKKGGSGRKTAPKPERRLSIYNLKEDIEKTNSTVVHAIVNYNFVAEADDEMDLKVGERITVTSTPDPKQEWWEGLATEGGSVRSGLFPSAYVSIVPTTAATDASNNADGVGGGDDGNKDATFPETTELPDGDSSADEEGGDVPGNFRGSMMPSPTKMKVDKKDSAVPNSPGEVESPRRKRIVEELISTEQDYVEHLHTICEGYIRKMRPLLGQLFADGAVEVFFSNIEQIEQRQQGFLDDLKKSVAAQGPSGAAQCFLKNKEVFKVYSIYCNNHDRGNRALDLVLQENEQVWGFFEGCRMLLKDQLSVAALMIKPVQRVCQYPLILTELLKATPSEHRDYSNVENAFDLMKDIALGINEDKRLKEQILAVEAKLDGWDGPGISVFSSKLYYEGPVNKISGSTNHERYLFLFDNLLVITRLPQKGRYRFARSGKIFTHECELEDVADAEFTHGMNPINNAFKLFNKSKEKWYVFSVKSKEEKAKWLESFQVERDDVNKAATEGVSLLALASTEKASTDDYVRTIQGGKKKNRRSVRQSVRGPRMTLVGT